MASRTEIVLVFVQCDAAIIPFSQIYLKKFPQIFKTQFMVKFFSLNQLLNSLRQISPSMLLLSITLHGILLALPMSSVLIEKPQLSKTVAKKEAPLEWLPLPSGGEIFNATNMLVHPKPPETTPSPAETALVLPPLPTSLPTAPPEVEPVEEIEQEVSVVPEEVEVQGRGDAVIEEAVIRGRGDTRKEETVTTLSPSPPPDVSIDSLTVSVDEFRGQTVEWIPRNLEKEAFDSILTSLEEEILLTVDLDFAEPEKFGISKFGLENIFGNAIGKTPNEIAYIVKKKLEAQNFKVSLIKSYGGGPLYKVQKGEFIEYISFAPTTNETGAIIVTWKNLPVH